MKLSILFMVVVLLVLHQDYWQWDDTTLDFGFLPRTLTYHSILSVVTAFAWMLATKFCWPQGLDEAPEHASQQDPVV